jgi:hypothetical protein
MQVRATSGLRHSGGKKAPITAVYSGGDRRHGEDRTCVIGKLKKKKWRTWFATRLSTEA